MSESPLKLGKYEILRELGRGAMGVVYEAFDPSIERTVALKTIRRDQLEGAEAQDVITRFQREAKAAGRLNHPNIVSIFDFGTDNDVTYIAMEFIHGRELRDYFEKNERFPITEAVRIMGQLLDALDYSHNYGVVHRDIKPANIIIQPNGQVKVADFGIARIESSQYTQAGTVLGTPAYMSPEQFMGQTVDRRSDIFSAGIILYQFLTGEKPFTGTATTIMHKVLSVEPPPPSMLNVQAPKPFDTIVAKAMAKRPENRFQTAREFADTIQKALSETPAVSANSIPAPSEGTLIDTGSTNDSVEKTVTLKMPPPASSATPAPATAKSQAPLILAAAASVAVIGIAAGYFMLFRGSASDASVSATNANSPVAVTSSAPPPAPPVHLDPGTMLISAVGLADPNDQKYQSDKSLLTADLRADSQSQLIEKAVALYLDHASLAKNYELVRDKLLSKSSDYIANIVQQGEPQLGKDGLMYVTTQAAVKVREVQKSLNQMSHDERIDFIRNNGDPKVSVSITTPGEGDMPPQNSQIAENLLKERIKSFGFRIWSDEAQGNGGADFAVVGEAKIKRLSARLAASGITIDKYLLTSWTVKCIDRQSGEEIYYNNKMPVGEGSWATPEQALSAIGTKIADEFSRDFFIQHFNTTGQHVELKITGLPDKATEDAIGRELIGLQPVIGITRRGGSDVTYDLQLAGGNGPRTDLVANAILNPLNAKLGQECFKLGATMQEQVAVTFDQACTDKSLLARFYANPPASLYAAPPARQKSVLKNPNAIKKVIT